MDDGLPDDATSLKGTRDWPHAPPHRLAQSGVYFVTARTLERRQHFLDPARRTFLKDQLLALARRYKWRIEAWAVLSNHYIFVGHSLGNTEEEPRSAESLRVFLRHFHGEATRHVNQADELQGRKIWHNFRETLLTYQRSYLARLNYTHYNPVHHGLVENAVDYEWCSAREFEASCMPAWVRTVYSFKFDEIVKRDGDDDECAP